MREIKFRAWDNEAKLMRHAFFIASTTGKCHSVTPALQEESLELMQFTGIKDKQGTDIYEGDIVQNQQPYFKGIVYFKRGSFWVREIFSRVDEGIYDGDREKETQWSIDLAYKIIGNIYETPELLERT